MLASFTEAMRGRVRSADIAVMAGAGSGVNGDDAMEDSEDEAGGCSGDGTAAAERQNADPEALFRPLSALAPQAPGAATMPPPPPDGGSTAGGPSVDRRRVDGKAL